MRILTSMWRWTTLCMLCTFRISRRRNRATITGNEIGKNVVIADGIYAEIRFPTIHPVRTYVRYQHTVHRYPLATPRTAVHNVSFVIDEPSSSLVLLEGYSFTIRTYNGISFYHVIIDVRKPCRSFLLINAFSLN